MNARKAVLTLTFAIFTASSLYAGPCINCVATVLKKVDTQKTSKWSSKSITKTENKKNSTKVYYVDNITTDSSEEYINGMIPLDDNSADIVVASTETIIEDDSNIVLTYDPSTIKLAKTLYACEDIANNIVACDNDKKEECECV